MEEQRKRSQAASKFGVDLRESVQLDHRTIFKGYELLEDTASVVALLDENGASVQELAAGARGRVVLEHTPFYAESGGQVGDTGRLQGDHGEFVVEDTRKLRDAFAHAGTVAQGRLKDLGRDGISLGPDHFGKAGQPCKVSR